MAVKLHRCKNLWVKGPHPCWKVQSAMDEAGVNYEIVKEKYIGPREETVRRTGQKRFPWVEFEDGSVYREESKDMAQRIGEGQLEQAPRSQSPSASATA